MFAQVSIRKDCFNITPKFLTVTFVLLQFLLYEVNFGIFD